MFFGKGALSIHMDVDEAKARLGRRFWRSKRPWKKIQQAQTEVNTDFLRKVNYLNLKAQIQKGLNI